mmetsp:Transcript_4258/g.10108  ORF Transcript_4258/g.10108 Transcript_4258/m.10108 type:complete len:546 (+) Transcript_4258:39-1676(+)|eukprot:CAMPEP_0114555420 /NCGR_PEP_ID=MMETSP0114-20121206/8739_1 /TAXON_ID=31324 /ORGANISM="Goniomonas sp, Strain m" /LENGTH=545 /DNA_ID=CAMNT_0001740543 /DNA_START=36 /DNA_END=1673 /DNA_ORIENTATION=+
MSSSTVWVAVFGTLCVAGLVVSQSSELNVHAFPHGLGAQFMASFDAKHVERVCQGAASNRTKWEDMETIRVCLDEALGKAINESQWDRALEVVSSGRRLKVAGSSRNALRWGKWLAKAKSSLKSATKCNLIPDLDAGFEFQPSDKCYRTLVPELLANKEWQRSLDMMLLARKLTPSKRRQYWTRQISALKLHMDNLANGRPLPEVTFKPVEVRSKLSLPAFYTEYAAKQKPVVMTDIVEIMGVMNYSTDYFKKKCPTKKVEPKAQMRSYGEWGGLVQMGNMTLAEYIDGLNSTTKHLYVHDEPLPGECHRALEDFTMPKYFCNDYMQRMPMIDPDKNGTRHWMIGDERGWPSLFIGPNGTKSLMHKDSLRTQFWMAMVQGTKRWTLFLEEDEPLLAPNGVQYQVDAVHPDYEKYPLFRYASGYQHILQPGELIYVPGASPHQVENLEFTMAITGNYIDAYSVHMTVEDARARVKEGTDDHITYLYLKWLLHKDFNFEMDPTLDHHQYYRDFTQIAVKNTKRLLKKIPNLDELIQEQFDEIDELGL